MQWLRGRYSLLLLSLVLLGLTYPLLFSERGAMVWRLSFWAALLAAVRAYARTRPEKILGYTLFGLACVMFLLERLGVPVVAIGQPLVHLAIFTITGRTILWDVFRGRRITADNLIGSACFYIFLGLGWAHGFWFLEQVSDAPAFQTVGGEGLAAEPRLQIAELLYYSYVTLTTLGYGDIVPVSPMARFIASAEAIVGQLYLTILVARFVGLHIAHSNEELAK